MLLFGARITAQFLDDGAVALRQAKPPELTSAAIQIQHAQLYYFYVQTSLAIHKPAASLMHPEYPTQTWQGQVQAARTPKASPWLSVHGGDCMELLLRLPTCRPRGCTSGATLLALQADDKAALLALEATARRSMPLSSR